MEESQDRLTNEVESFMVLAADLFVPAKTRLLGLLARQDRVAGSTLVICTAEVSSAIEEGW